MKTTTYTAELFTYLRFPFLRMSAFFLAILLLRLGAQSVCANSATWKANPTTGDWHTTNNWSPQSVPDAATDIATFGSSSKTAISINDTNDTLTDLAGITFNPGASAYTITLEQSNFLYFEGAGVTNNSGVTQTITIVPYTGFLSYLSFYNSATAGTSMIYNIGFDQYTYFYNGSTAGSATFNLNGATSTYFYDTASAGTATFNLYGTDSFFDLVFFNTGTTAGNATFNIKGTGNGNQCQFIDGSSAGAALFTLDGAVDNSHGPGYVIFYGGDAGSATFVANAALSGNSGSVIYFVNNSTGGTSRIEVFGNGIDGDVTNAALDITQHLAPGVTIGSLEGGGAVRLANRLTVGSNNLTTAFSGIISGSGSLAKTGKGKFTLSNANTYTDGTTVSKGALLVTNRTGSATGTGTVSVNAGTLGGTGKISGAVTIGTATTAAILAPGSGTRPGKLTLSSTLTFNAPG